MDTAEMENWGENWSSSSDSDESGSSYSDESNSSLRMEAVRVGGESFLLPQSLCDNAEVFKEFMSLDLLNSFTDQQKEHLNTFLPSFPEKDSEEKAATLDMLFNRENIRFGNPLTEFHKHLRAAHFRPDVSRMRALLRKAQYKDYKRSEKWRLYELVKSVLASRQRLVDSVVNGEKPKVFPTPPKKPRTTLLPNVRSRYFQELALIREEVGESSQSSDDDNFSEGPLLSKKARRNSRLAEMSSEMSGSEVVLGTLCSGPSPWDQGKSLHYSPYSVPDQSYQELLAAHSKRRASREVHPDLHVAGLTMHDVAQRCNKHMKKSSSSRPLLNKKSKAKVSRPSSISSPMLDDELIDTSDTEETGSILIKQELDEDNEKVVDIEAVDDMPSFPAILRQNANLSNQISPKNNRVATSKRSHKVTVDPSETGKKIMNEESSRKHTEGKKSKVSVLKAEIEVKKEEFEFPVAPIKNSSTRILTPATLSDLDGIDMMDLPVDFDESSPLSLEEINHCDFLSRGSHPELSQETHSCFFSLIRDILLSTPDHRIEMRELECRVRAWAHSPIGPLSPWYSPHLESQLTSAVHFLAAHTSEVLPDDYVPYMEWKSTVKAYQWIGAGRDSDHRLVPLCVLWSERGGGSSGGASAGHPLSGGSGGRGGQDGASVVAPRGPAVQPTSPRDRNIFRHQEKQRYETPFRAYTYRVGDVERIVGPVRSTQTSNLSKARGHSLLIDDRPKYVTILELVRDAVARLPNAQGTRADIVTLLKDSQYLSENAQESMLSSVVSGALDRLHYENDPSVKYDAKRKIWVYLHRGRSQEEFERLHALGANMKPSRPKPTRKPSKPKKEAPSKTESENSDGKSEAESHTSVGVSFPSPSVPLVVKSNKSIVTSRPVNQQAPGGGIATPTKKVTTESVKSLLNKSRVKVHHQEGGGGGLLKMVPTQQNSHQPQHLQQAGGTSVKRSEILQKQTLLPTRAIVHEAATSPRVANPQNIVKKSVTLSADQVAKATASGKSIVKVITTSQAPTHSAVRTVQRVAQAGSQTSPQQQMIQLKHQLLGGTADKLVKAGGGGSPGMGTIKKPTQQQVIVMKQGQPGEGGGSIVGGTSGGGGGGQQQMIVINQQQILMDSSSLSLKQQKQLQQIITKQQVEQQSNNTVTLQQQLHQLLLGKQGDQSKGVVVSKSSSPMIVVKPTTTDGSGKQIQQMILVKQSNDADGTTTTAQITQQQLQQMILLKQQQQQQQHHQQQQQQQQQQTQQMIIVKQEPKSMQVITQPSKGQQVTLAQLQQQRIANTTSLLTHPRVVAHVSSSGGTSVMKTQVPQVSTSSGSMVAKVVAGAGTTQLLTMESLLTATKQQSQALATHQGGVRVPSVSRGVVPPQFAVVTLPQQRVVQTTVPHQVTGGHESGVKLATTQSVRIPGLNLAHIGGKQVLLASKPSQQQAPTATLQGQNVLLGSTAGGQTLLVGGSGQQLTVLQQGAQQILIQPGALKTLQGLKVIPLTQSKQITTQQGRQQVFARIINPGNARPVLTATASIVQQQPSQSQNPQESNMSTPSTSKE